jgi:hypothetical protein
MLCEIKIECLLCATNEVVFVLYPSELAFENVDGVHCRIGSDVTLYGPRLLPFSKDFANLILDNLVLGDDFQLKAS